MSARASGRALRDRTRDHYDKYPFRFDQRVIVDEKMEHRVMGAAIRDLTGADNTVLDVGCGACRVAHMVREASKGRVVGVDLSLQTLRSAKLHNPDPVVNGDNQRLPLRSDCANLVISNGVIMVTPDARASFGELARITRPGGTLVVSVYDRSSWYYPVYRYGSPMVRKLRDWIGDMGLRFTLFPFFHLGILVLLGLVVRKPFWVPLEISWNLFHDQFTTPHCTFHSAEELAAWAADEGLLIEDTRKEAANQLITLRLRKPG